MRLRAFDAITAVRKQLLMYPTCIGVIRLDRWEGRRADCVCSSLAHNRQRWTLDTRNRRGNVQQRAGARI